MYLIIDERTRTNHFQIAQTGLRYLRINSDQIQKTSVFTLSITTEKFKALSLSHYHLTGLLSHIHELRTHHLRRHQLEEEGFQGGFAFRRAFSLPLFFFLSQVGI